MKKEFSIFRYQYWMTKGMSKEDAIKKVSEIQRKNSKKRIYDRKFNCRCIEYYLNKGYSLEDGYKIIHDLQSKYSKLSSKYKNKKSTYERNKKISNSMKNHINNIGKNKWLSHFGNSISTISKAEIEIYNYIKNNINKNVQAQVNIDDYIVDIQLYDCIIEYFGDLWHASPLMEHKKDVIEKLTKKTINEIRSYDDKKINKLKK